MTNVKTDNLLCTQSALLNVNQECLWMAKQFTWAHLDEGSRLGFTLFLKNFIKVKEPCF